MGDYLFPKKYPDCPCTWDQWRSQLLDSLESDKSLRPQAHKVRMQLNCNATPYCREAYLWESTILYTASA